MRFLVAEGGLKRDLAVGEVARRSGIPVSTVHFYEAKGLIAGWRTEGNQRRYHRAVLRRIAIIRVAQRAGIPLATIHDALAGLPHDHAPNAGDWRHFTEAWKAMLEERKRCSAALLAETLDGCEVGHRGGRGDGATEGWHWC